MPTALDVETIWVGEKKISIPVSIAWRSFDRDPHEYVGDRKKGTLVHAPLHTGPMNVYFIDEVLKSKEFQNFVKTSDAWSRKLLDMFMNTSEIQRAPFEEILEELCDDVMENGGVLMGHSVYKDTVESLWNADRIFNTGIFPNGPQFKSPKIPNWTDMTIVCTKKAFTDPSLNEKFLKKYPDLIDLSLEALVMAIRRDHNFHQSHLPQDDVDLLIEVLDHVYTRVSKQDYWNLVNMKRDHYDCIPVNVHKPACIQFDTTQVFVPVSSKN